MSQDAFDFYNQPIAKSRKNVQPRRCSALKDGLNEVDNTKYKECHGTAKGHYNYHD
jgi:hypothetical protein